IPRKRRRASRKCEVNAVPTKPPAPVTAIKALSRGPGIVTSDPLPAVLAIETYAASHERFDMPPPFACGFAAVMNDAHRWHVRGGCDARQPHAPIVILEVEEERRVEAAGPIDRRAAHEHEGAGERRHAEHFAGWLDVDEIAHFVVIEPAAEQRAHDTRCETAQQQIEHRRIT